MTKDEWRAALDGETWAYGSVERAPATRRPDTRPSRGPARDITRPEPGYFRARQVRGGPWCAARIYYATARDPDTGELLDRAPQLLCLVAGEHRDPWEAWPSLHPVDEAEYRRLLDSMHDEPGKAVDVRRERTF